MQKTAYELRISDWSSDVCSSDLANQATGLVRKRLPNDALPAATATRELRDRRALAKAKFGDGQDVTRLSDDQRHHARTVGQRIAGVIGTAVDTVCRRVVISGILAASKDFEQTQDRKSTRLNSSH